VTAFGQMTCRGQVPDLAILSIPDETQDSYAVLPRNTVGLANAFPHV
jgi:hypothetical protein